MHTRHRQSDAVAIALSKTQRKVALGTRNQKSAKNVKTRPGAHNTTVLNPRNESFKMIACILNIQKGCRRRHMRVRDNHHNVGIGRKGVNEGGKP